MRATHRRSGTIADVARKLEQAAKEADETIAAERDAAYRRGRDG